MKHTKYFTLLLTCILFATSVAAQVAISPANPTTEDDLVCSLQGANNALYMFEWSVNNEPKMYGQYLVKSFTEPSQTWTCRISLPPTPYTGVIIVGEASVSFPAVLPINNTNTTTNTTNTTNTSVVNLAPVSQFSISSSYATLNTSFTDTSSDDGSITAWFWDFGDGFNATEQHPIHIYADNGTFTVVLAVQDNNGTWNQSSQQVNVNPLHRDDYGSWYYDEALSSVAICYQNEFIECNPSNPSSYDDGSDDTVDSCVRQGCFYAKKNIIPNVYGNVTDLNTGNSLFNISISFADGSLFNPDALATDGIFTYNKTVLGTDAGSFELMTPNAVPDVMTLENGLYAAYVPYDATNILFRGSSEDEYDAKPKDLVNDIIIPSIAGQSDINVTITVQSASAGLKSNIFVINSTNSLFSQKILFNSAVGTSWSRNFSAGTELNLVAEVDARPWKLKVDRLFDGKVSKTSANNIYSYYNHTSYGKYAQIDQLDYDTYRVHFEDLPDGYSGIDWDFNDIVVLVDMNTIPPQAGTTPFNDTTYDCDNDGTKDWLDQDDYSCDVGQRDTEVNEEIPVITNFNAEGHILYSGKLHNGNKYACGEPLTFVMFGVNNGNVEENITFTIQDQTSGNPNNGPLVYNGSYSNPAEVLTVPAGAKVNKTFEFIIPCSYNAGKYSAYVVWDGIAGPWHKLGTFFVIDQNTQTRPELGFTTANNYGDTLISTGQYVNQTFNTTIIVKSYPLVQTVSGLIIAQDLVSAAVLASEPCIEGPGVEVELSAPQGQIVHNGIRYNDSFRLNLTNNHGVIGCLYTPTFVYEPSDRFTINITAHNENFTDSRYINATIWATEQQARDIWYDITNYNFNRPVGKEENFTGFYMGDHCSGVGGYCIDNLVSTGTTISSTSYGYTSMQLDYDNFALGNTGFEYRSHEDGLDVGSFTYPQGSPSFCQNEPEVNGTGATECERDALTTQWNGLFTGDNSFVLVIGPSTTQEVAQKISYFADYLFVQNGKSP